MQFPIPSQWRNALYYFRGLLVVAGAFLVHLSLGSIYTFGNMAPYIVSYVRNQSHPENMKQETTTWTISAAAIGQGGAMIVGGAILQKLGPRWTTLAGGWVMSLGVFLSYLTIKVSFWLFLVSYGLIYGAGVGIAYIGPLTTVMRWMPKWKGVANGVVLAGFGLSALIFNLVQTIYVNPHNIDPVINPNGEKYFVDSDLLQRIPKLFLILGGVFASMQLVGSLLLVYPPGQHTNTDQSYIRINTKEETDNSSISSSKGTDWSNNSKFPKQGIMDQSASEEKTLLPEKLTVKSETDDDSMGPKQVLLTGKFYIMFCMFLANGLGVTFVSSLYKFIGQEFINDDHFLAVVGSVASVCNCVGRITWGLIADTSSFSTTLVILTSTITAFMLTVEVTPFGGKSMFLIWICAIFFCIGGNYSIFPAATGKVFGLRYVSLNYGILFISQLIAGLAGALLSTILKSHIGYDGLLFLASGCTATTLLLAVCYRVK